MAITSSFVTGHPRNFLFSLGSWFHIISACINYCSLFGNELFHHLPSIYQAKTWTQTQVGFRITLLEEQPQNPSFY